MGVDLVAVADVVDQARCERLGRGERCPRHGGPHVVAAEGAAGGDARDGVVDDRVGHPLHHLAVGGAHLGGRELVGGRLVLVALAELRVDAQLLQATAQQRDAQVHAGQAERTRRLDPHLAGVDGEPVAGQAAGELAERRRPRDRRLVLREVGDHGAHLVGDAQRERARTDVDEQPEHVVVGGREAKPVADRAQRGRVARAQRLERVAWRSGLQSVAEVELEHGARPARTEAGDRECTQVHGASLGGEATRRRRQASSTTGSVRSSARSATTRRISTVPILLRRPAVSSASNRRPCAST